MNKKNAAFAREEKAKGGGQTVFERLFDCCPDAILVLDSQGCIQRANAQCEPMFGYRRGELLGRPLNDLLLQPLPLADSEGPAFGAAVSESVGLHKDGREVPVEVALCKLTEWGTLPLAVFVRDVAERRRGDVMLQRLNRMHRVLSSINTMIVRVRDRGELFREACRIAVEQGGFKLAWIGLAEGDFVRLGAYHGQGGFLDQIRIGLREPFPHGEPPTIRALRSRQMVVCNDIASDPTIVKFRDGLLQSGARSLLVQPLTVGDKVVGCLSLNAGEVDFFDEAEIKLLAELGGDISYALEFIERYERLDYLAYYDPLTRLANRRLFFERVNELIQAARHYHKQLALLVFDLGRFKSVNDTFGRAVGDQLLKAVAARLVRFASSSQYLARMGADQFAAVVPDLSEVSDLSAILEERLYRRMARSYKLGTLELHVDSKLGIALFPGDGEDAETLFRNAEVALKKAKNGGEHFMFYTQQMRAAVEEKLSLENQLRRALARREFVLHYQPKLDLRSGAICGAEALIRWNSPDLGLVPPFKFIPLLEETGMIQEVGRWALEQAVDDHHSWLIKGLPAPRVAVNVSARQLRRPDFADVVRGVLARQPREAPGIELEITESMLMEDSELHIQKLKALRAMGLDVALDDFGTGYSSLAYLGRLPISAVKIDRSFIVSMGDNADTMSIVSTIITLARSMDLKVIAEGVDSQEQLKFLRLLRCDEMQGFLYSAAVPAEEFAQLLREGRRLSW
jgi:diguanylate cyclase (GGDEF)-like protein/PAS domain S-box-containing protein